MFQSCTEDSPNTSVLWTSMELLQPSYQTSEIQFQRITHSPAYTYKHRLGTGFNSVWGRRWCCIGLNSNYKLNLPDSEKSGHETSTGVTFSFVNPKFDRRGSAKPWHYVCLSLGTGPLTISRLLVVQMKWNRDAKQPCILSLTNRCDSMKAIPKPWEI